jgi:uncharacterized membrane protein YphA (DoxX/SURF4 family)
MISWGSRVLGLAAIALGLVGLVWADFASVWQPVPPEMPGRLALAYLAAALFVVAGAGLQWRRTAPWSALLLAALVVPYAALWARRVIGFPGIFATWSGFCEQLALIAGAAMAYACLRPGARRLALAGRLIFGLCLVAFGTAHFLYVGETAAMVPAWIPPGGRAWALATGACHLAGGLALLSGILAKLAARLVTAMFAGFGLLVWLSQLFAGPQEHMAWAGNAINLLLTGAAWAVADSIARYGAGRVLASAPPSDS